MLNAQMHECINQYNKEESSNWRRLKLKKRQAWLSVIEVYQLSKDDKPTDISHVTKIFIPRIGIEIECSTKIRKGII